MLPDDSSGDTFIFSLPGQQEASFLIHRDAVV